MKRKGPWQIFEVDKHAHPCNLCIPVHALHVLALHDQLCRLLCTCAAYSSLLSVPLMLGNGLPLAKSALPPEDLMASSNLHSAFEVGLLNGKMIGRVLSADSACKTNCLSVIPMHSRLRKACDGRHRGLSAPQVDCTITAS